MTSKNVLKILVLGLLVLGSNWLATAKTTFEDDVLLINCGGFPGQAKRRFRIETGNVHDVRIEISNAPSGPYSVIIQGVDRGVISVDSLGQGEIEYSTNPQAGEHPLNFPFDVGTEVDLSFQGTRLAYSLSNDSACQNAGGSTSSSTSTSTSSTSTSTSLGGSSTTTTTNSSSTSTTSTTLGGGGSCQAIDNTVSLVNCGAIRGATGTRRVRVHLDCDRDVRYQIKKVPNGNYSVFVTDTDGNLKRGTIKVVSKNQGEIEFDDTPAVNEFPLTFDPFGPVSIVRDATGARVFGYPNCQ